MTTSFTLSHDSKTYELFAERVALNESLETWRVSARGDMNRFITLTNNRPFLHERHQYKAFYKWTMVEGDQAYKRIKALITNHLEYFIKGQWKPPKKGKPQQTPSESPQGKLF